MNHPVERQAQREFTEVMRRILLACFAIVFSITMSVLVMIHGWGLSPQSWWWIIGINFASQAFAQILISLAKD